jgi:RNA polymerase sigma-70 factor (ECF subfamily)
MQNDDDAALVAGAARGDTSAFEALVTKYQRVLFSVAHRMLGDYADAADATQTAFIKAYQKLGSFDPSFRFYSWIYRILLNECLNARRDRKNHERITPDLAGAASPHDDVEAAERRQRVQRALSELPAEYRQVIVLRHFGELSYDDIAAVLGIETKTVKSRLYTARQRLTELLSDTR